jgi:hypothetical protein
VPEVHCLRTLELRHRGRGGETSSWKRRAGPRSGWPVALLSLVADAGARRNLPPTVPQVVPCGGLHQGAARGSRAKSLRHLGGFGDSFCRAHGHWPLSAWQPWGGTRGGARATECGWPHVGPATPLAGPCPLHTTTPLQIMNDLARARETLTAVRKRRAEAAAAVDAAKAGKEDSVGRSLLSVAPPLVGTVQQPSSLPSTAPCRQASCCFNRDPGHRVCLSWGLRFALRSAVPCYWIDSPRPHGFAIHRRTGPGWRRRSSGCRRCCSSRPRSCSSLLTATLRWALEVIGWEEGEHVAQLQALVHAGASDAAVGGRKRRPGWVHPAHGTLRALVPLPRPATGCRQHAQGDTDRKRRC